jgi:hypothetical protein
MIKDSVFNGWLRLMKNKNLQAALVLMLFLILFYRDVVFYGKTFLIETASYGTMPGLGPYNYKGDKPGFVANDAGAIAWQTEPFNRFISTSLKRGDFPLWNPYAGLAGSPLLADGHTGPLEPIQFLFFFVPGRYWPYAVDTQLLIRFFLAGFFCYLFARRQKIGFLGSISAGALFMFSSYFVTFGNHPQIKTEVLLPLVLYGYDRLTDPEDRKGLWSCALFIGWAIVAAMPEATFFPLFLGTLWYFYKSTIRWVESGRVFAEAKNAFLRYLGTTVIGFLISAVYLLPFIEFVSLAANVHSGGAGGYAFPLWALPNLLFQVQGSFYLQLGFFTLFPLVFLLLCLKDWPLKYRRDVVFLGSYAIIFIFTIYSFSLTNWIRLLPVFKQIILSKYSIPSIVFCLALLMGMFIDVVTYIPLSYRKLLLSLLIILVLFIGSPVLGNPTKSLNFYFADENSMRAALYHIFSLVFILFLLIYFYGSKDISVRVLQVGLLFLVLSEPFFWRAGIKRPDRVDPFQTPPFVDYLRDDSELFRIFALDGILYPNISTAYRLADIRWLNALIPRRAFEFSANFLQPDEVYTMRFTGTALPVSDELFDLLNVKYILDENISTKDTDICLLNTDIQPYFGAGTINKVILEQNPEKKDVLTESILTINKVSKTTIFAHPPQEFGVKLFVPKSASTLYFSVGLDSKVFLPDRGDGVDFHITLTENSSEFDLFSKYLDPKNNPCERRWFDENVNLDQWAGKEIVLSFSTSTGPMGDDSWDWAFWGDIQLAKDPEQLQFAEDATSLQHYNLVYESNSVDIYRNENAFPRAFVAYNVINSSTFDDTLQIMADPELDLRQTAVIENLPADLENRVNQDGQETQFTAGRAQLISSGELKVEVSAKAPGILIVTDQYYPGWKAFVDGVPTPIYAVDGIFRGVFLEEGSHVIEFKYQPLSFIIGAVVSLGSFLATISFLYISYRSKSSQNE